MNDCISRQAVLDELNKWDWQELYLPIHFKENIIDVVPSVNPQEPKTGRWILTDDDFVYCSECEDSYYPRPIDASWYYCPHCGCRMQESEVSE